MHLGEKNLFLRNIGLFFHTVSFSAHTRIYALNIPVPVTHIHVFYRGEGGVVWDKASRGCEDFQRPPVAGKLGRSHQTSAVCDSEVFRHPRFTIRGTCT